MTPVSPFIERFEHLRRIHGLSQAAVARALGVDDSQVSRWRRGKSQPAWENVEKLGELFQVDPLELWALVTRPANNPTGLQATQKAALDQEITEYKDWYAHLMRSKVPSSMWRAYTEACEAMADAFGGPVVDAIGRQLGATVRMADPAALSTDEPNSEEPRLGPDGKPIVFISRLALVH